jgi:predicted PurR-regulated permease PerM
MGSPDRLHFGAVLDIAARVAVVGLFALALLYAAVRGQFFLVPVTTALIVGMTFGPAIDWLERRRVPSALASLALISMLALGVYGLYLALAVPLETWISRLPEIWSKFTQHLSSLREPLRKLNEVSREVEEATGTTQSPVAVKVEDKGFLSTILALAPPLAAQFLLFFGTLYFFIATRTRLRKGLLSLCSARRIRLRVARIVRDVENLLSRYLASIAIVNVGLGVATTLMLLAIGMPSPVLWGTLAAILNFIPYLGPAVVTAVLAGVGSATFDGLLPSLTPALAFVGLNVVESQLVTPTVVGRNLTLNPFLVFLSLGFWLWIWGPIGAFVAVPLLLIGAIVVNHLLPAGTGSSLSAFGRPQAARRRARS